ncbi:hypothetical protein N0V95_009203 [Ascochyta clinopodiicola]|nr:hypothetical protein N0V95_009203 [Ascochyta clinopodiicola]
MASFANPLRRIWARSQALIPLSSGTLTNLDGASDGEFHGQREHNTTSQQHLNEGLPTGNGIAPPVPRQHAQASILQQYGQPPQQVAASPNAFGRDEGLGFGEVSKELGDKAQDRYGTETPQHHVRPSTAFVPTTSSEHILVNGHARDSGSLNTSANASKEIHVKQEPAVGGINDHDIFAEFTHQESDDDDTRMSTDNEGGPKSTHVVVNQNLYDTPLDKQEPGVEEQPHRNTVERAGSVDSVTSTTHNKGKSLSTALDQALTTSAVEVAILPKAELEKSDVSGSFDQHILSILPLSRKATSTYRSSIENHGLAPQQPESSPHIDNVSPRSLSADSVLGPQRPIPNEDAWSLQDVDLSNLRAQQWQKQWQQQQQQQQQNTLYGADVLTAGQMHTNPRLLHDPMSVQRQQSTYAMQPGPNAQYSTSTQYPSPISGSQHGQVHPYLMVPGHVSSPSMQYGPGYGYPPAQAYSTHRPIDQQMLVAGQEATKTELSDDDEPLVTRAPRHCSPSANYGSRSPFVTVGPQSTQQQTASSVSTDPTKTTTKPTASGGKANSAIELSEDDEPISWKLPTYEVTYQPPATPADLPSAKISIPRLIREDVLLSPDHAEQEAQLFQHVFLPAQRALSTPDPEPAHAVLNFHTIAVMVLEAFVQFEIGDEMGRGYGFHGGHAAQRPLGTSTAADDEEPLRTRSARDANVDDIFFAVVDRWRAGMESGKETLRLIRGCQEFCDVALDVVYFVKEQGLVQPEVRRRKERKDKGVARGPRGGGGAGAGSAGAGAGGGGSGAGAGSATTNINLKEKPTPKRKIDALSNKLGTATELQGRKKVKTEAKSTMSKPKPKAQSKVKTKAKAKAKASASSSVGVTVLSARRK